MRTLAASVLLLALAPLSAAESSGARALAARLQDKAAAGDERRRLLKSLQNVRDPRELEALFEVARDSAAAADVSQAAWSALVDTALDAPEQARLLIARWLDARDSETRLRALSLIREGVWHASFAPRIRALLLKDPEEDVRAEAAAALGANEVLSAKPELRKAARDRSQAVREAAGEALSALENAEAD